MLPALILLSCTDPGPPAWTDLPTLTLEPGGEPALVDLGDYVSGGAGDLSWSASSDGELLVDSLGPRLIVAADADYRGSATVDLVVTDRKRRSAAATLPVVVGAAACPVRLSWQPTTTSVSAVQLEGELLDASGGDGAYTLQEDGSWTLDLDLAPGAWAYRVVEVSDFSQGSEERSFCDPQAEQISCPAGYKEPWETDWDHDCSQPDSSCDSLLVVPDCSVPQVALTSLDVNRTEGRFKAEIAVTPAISGALLDEFTLTLDEGPVPYEIAGNTFHVEHPALEPGRHTLRFRALDQDGAWSDELWVPFWTDVADPQDGFRDGLMYYVFVDRLADGDESINGGEGASATIADFAGGDWAGVRQALPYLDELGVRTLWISNPQDNAEGAWAGQCEADFAGYHAYWPDQARQPEEHFGTADELQLLVAEAHALGMRVVMDWVANHVHEDHPYADNADWFNGQALCEDANNWNDIPEECWFAPYLPDLDYTRTDVLVTMLDDALWWARTFDLDGFRVDAAKHMPHSVQYNLEARIQAEIEHTAAGGDEEFWTVGETFDGAERIAEYIGEDQLDGQFDFPLYYGIRAGFGGYGSLRDLSATIADSTARYDGALMSNFLGNHDVGRFITDLAWGGGSACGGDPFAEAGVPADSTWAYDRLALAWLFVLTRPEVPLVYYGDELGLPGFGDPDNRQPLWWYTGGTVTSVDQAIAGVQGAVGFEPMTEVLRTVAAVGAARRQVRALWDGAEVEWWLEDQVMAWARVADDGSAALVVLNASDSDRTLDNGLSFAGLPASGTLEDVVSGEELGFSGDWLSVQVPARSGRVLVLR